MKNINILKLSLYQIQMFLSVARFESITLASKSLNLAQPMLSKNIATIERELGLILFLREKGRLRLTPAGKILEAELGAAMEQIELAIGRAHTQQMVEMPPLRIGFPDSSSQEKCLMPSMSHFKNLHPEFSYNLEFYPFKDLPVELERGNLDVIFTALFEKSSIENMGLEYNVILKYPLTVHVTPNNPLAQKTTVSIKDLSTMRLIIPSPRIVPNYYQNVILRLFESLPVMPEVAYYASSSDAVAANVTKDDEVFISDINRRIESFYHLVRIPIEHTESGIILAWRKNSHPLVDSFAKNTIDYWMVNSIQ